MPAQKRPHPPPHNDDHHHHGGGGGGGGGSGGGGGAGAGDASPHPSSSSPPPPQQQQVKEAKEEEEEEEEEEDEAEDAAEDGEEPPPTPQPPPKVEPPVDQDDSDGEGQSESSQSAGDRDENNECPACRTHCASRRSLRDDPNYDALIAALYPDIDKYEEEELAFDEEERSRNRKIQESIAETLRRQVEALGRRRSASKAAAFPFTRRSHGNFRNNHGQNSYSRGRGRSNARDIAPTGSDDEDEELGNGNNDGSKESSSADEGSPDIRHKRSRRWPAPPRSSPARTAGNADVGGDENDDLGLIRENVSTSPLRAGNREMLAWGKNGARSQTRHGNSSGSNGRLAKGGRMAKLAEYLRNLDENDNELDVHLILLPLDGESLINLPTWYLCCRPSSSIRHLRQFVAHKTSQQAEEVEIYGRKPQFGDTAIKDEAKLDHLESLEILAGDESLAKLCASFISARGDMELVYAIKRQS
ncbi:putative E3 ubiquitin-protein ligase RING1a [Ananas comosus]|uniref:Putative E3 ubiquitin-protein ligase RING1a n=1 Tax=Ananas comosus TaxID=4615 RepID=A0A199W691_ANACO|nr:putative E3 ubiquitin-protein ligase RING1a [Ananas comosus]